MAKQPAKKRFNKPNIPMSKNRFVSALINWLYEWFGIIGMILRPISVVFIILSAVSLYFTQVQTGNNRLIFEILSSLIVAIAGGIISYYFIEHTGMTVVVKKSVGAIRNLQLIKSKIENINDRILKLNIDKSGEVSNLVENIHKDILNSISDWGDVNPNAEYLTDYYEVISSTKKEVADLKKDVKELEEQKR